LHPFGLLFRFLDHKSTPLFHKFLHLSFRFVFCELSQLIVLNKAFNAHFTPILPAPGVCLCPSGPRLRPPHMALQLYLCIVWTLHSLFIFSLRPEVSDINPEISFSYPSVVFQISFCYSRPNTLPLFFRYPHKICIFTFFSISDAFGFSNQERL